MGSVENLILYTNHRCPWAHRAHIALEALQIPYKEEIIDLDKPRTPEYLQVNPRGLVPSISWNGVILTESAIVAQFLADLHPEGGLLPPSTSGPDALKRAQILWFADTFMSKVWNAGISKSLNAKTDAEAEEHAEKGVAGLVKEIEPLLKDANPFFGGSDRITLAEVLTGSFVARFMLLAKEDIYPKSLLTSIPERAPNSWKWLQAVASSPAVTAVFPVESLIQGNKTKKEKARADA